MVSDMTTRIARAASTVAILMGAATFLVACSSGGSSADTTVATADVESTTTTEPMADDSVPTSDGSDESEMAAYCVNEAPLKSLDLATMTSDEAGEASMALDAVYSGLPTSMHKGAGPLLDYLMQYATMGGNGNGAPYEAALADVQKWFATNC